MTTESTTAAPEYEIGSVRWAARNRLAAVEAVLVQLQRYAEVIERDGLEFDPSPAKMERHGAVRAYPSPTYWKREPWIEHEATSLDEAHAVAAEINEAVAADRAGLDETEIERVEVVSRWRWTLPDGTTITTTWQTHDTNEEG